MKIQTTRFGQLEIYQQKIISFPRGIPGFENLQRFIILPVEGTEDISWLQALDEPDVALMVIDPFKLFNGYACDIPTYDVEELDLKNPAETLVLTTVTVPRDTPSGTTTNLVAPIIINTRTNKAKQVILSGSVYTTKHRLFPADNAKKPGRPKGKTSKKTVGGEGK